MTDFEHDLDCPYWHAVNANVGIECEHGCDVCPTCDPCTCHDGLVLITEETDSDGLDKEDDRLGQGVRPGRVRLPCVRSIHIHYYPPRRSVRSLFGVDVPQEETCKATVKFSKGDTSGEREFSGKDIPGVMAQVEAFMRRLEG